MHRLCSLLGMPQHRFASIHVVGTNGKTSVTRMTAALLEAAGVRTGAYTSPHIRDWRERIEIGGEPISEEALHRALERAEESAAVADRAAGEEGPVTQYELLTAAAFVAFAEARVEVAVIEAGLGGRLDATNVIPSKLTVLTSVGLDHTEWLGETLEEIAAEKLAVLRDHSTLLTGALPPEAQPVAEREAERRHAKLAVGHGGRLEPRQRVPGRKLRPGAGRSRAARGEVRSGGGAAPDRAARRRRRPGSRPSTAGPGRPGRRLRRRPQPRRGPRPGRDPPGPGRGRGRRLLPRRARRARTPSGIVEALAPACARFVCTEIPEEAMRGTGRPDAESMPGRQELAAALRRGPGSKAEAVADPWAAWERATRACARARRGGAGGRFPLPSQLHMDREARGELLTMMGLVALVVAVVILVFFAIGYVFGLFFL